MPKTDVTALWFDSDLDDKPHRVQGREELLVFQTEAYHWSDAGICAPFEILLASRRARGFRSSTAYARPIQNEGLPYLALGHQESDGPHRWHLGNMERDYAPNSEARQHDVRHALPALLQRRLWGRVLCLDRELNLADDENVVMRLYLGANGLGQWCVMGLTDISEVKADFGWDEENSVALLLGFSDKELLEWVYARAEDLESDLAFSLNWAAWGTTQAANERRVMLNFQPARGSMQEMREVLELAVRCDPELARLDHFSWEINPLVAPSHSLGSPESWRKPFEPKRLPSEYLYDGQIECGLPPFTRRIRDWAHAWFAVEPDQALRARYRCVFQVRGNLSLVIERKSEFNPTAHEQLEALMQLHEFLAGRVAPDELTALLKLD